MRFYGSNGTSVEELASIGIKTVGADNIIAWFGSSTTGSSNIAIVGISDTNIGIQGRSSSNAGVNGISDTSAAGLFECLEQVLQLMGC